MKISNTKFNSIFVLAFSWLAYWKTQSWLSNEIQVFKKRMILLEYYELCSCFSFLLFWLFAISLMLKDSYLYFSFYSSQQDENCFCRSSDPLSVHRIAQIHSFVMACDCRFLPKISQMTRWTWPMFVSSPPMELTSYVSLDPLTRDELAVMIFSFLVVLS